MIDDWPHLDGWTATAAGTLVTMIDGRLSDVHWLRIHDGDGMWRWMYSDENESFGVAVNGRDDAQMVTPFHGWPEKAGPTVMAWHRPNDPLASVTLPNMTDGSDLRGALRVLAAVVPDLEA